MPIPRNTVDELEALEQLVANVLMDLNRIQKQGKPGITRAVRRLNQVRVRLLALQVALEHRVPPRIAEAYAGSADRPLGWWERDRA